eukprot:11456899-Alexandrium_andersonii.AAC.1
MQAEPGCVLECPYLYETVFTVKAFRACEISFATSLQKDELRIFFPDAGDVEAGSACGSFE